ncbi:hypothetical protein EDB85DRAFT_1888295 [Lactarius pseudohatsudake]|nr:hypothetical protein EDB85DRAFT_1888295 [Lactarius pseudohatsudake]
MTWNLPFYFHLTMPTDQTCKVQAKLKPYASKPGPKKLKKQKELEAYATSFPDAVSTKRERIVTCPDVDQALYLWVKSMEAKNEIVTGCLLGPFVANKMGRHIRYQICETKKHGEATSVDQVAVIAKQEKVWEILAQFVPKDHFNLNKTALLPYAVPDCGLATVHISGKKINKFWITLALLCNTDGSQKFPIFYIGKAKHPVAIDKT